MSKLKQYRDIEKALEQKYKDISENEATLDADDFKDGKLTVCGYDRLKKQCDYIPFSEEIEIKIPKRYEKGFKNTLEQMAANELFRIKKDRHEARIAAIALLFGGIATFLLGSLLEFRGNQIFEYIAIIVSWVFIWAAVEKWFFDRKDLREKRKSLLQILTAKVTPQE